MRPSPGVDLTGWHSVTDPATINDYMEAMSKHETIEIAGILCTISSAQINAPSQDKSERTAPSAQFYLRFVGIA